MSPRTLISKVTLAIAVISSACGSQPLEKREYSSPNGVYKITLLGKFGRPQHVWARTHISGSVLRIHGTVQTDLRVLDEMSYLDDGFDEQYRFYNWSAANV